MAMTATVLKDLVVRYESLLDRHELRGSSYPLLNKGIENANNPTTGIISPDLLEKALDSWGRGIDIPVMSPAANANGTGLTCTFSGTEAISDFVNVTWVTISNGFNMQPVKNKQNEIKYMQEYARKFTDAMRSMALALDGAVDTTLLAALTPAAQYGSTYVGVGAKYGALVADKIQVSLANRPDFFNDLVDIMAEDDLLPDFDVLSSTNGRGIIRQLFAQGDANATNTRYQFDAGDFQFNFGKRVTKTAGATIDATGYVMPKGAYGLVWRVRPDCEAMRSTTDGKIFGMLNPADLPEGVEIPFNAPVGTLYSSTCGTAAVESGNAADSTAVLESHQFEVHYGILTPYSNFATSAVPAVIRAYDLLNV